MIGHQTRFKIQLQPLAQHNAAALGPRKYFIANLLTNTQLDKFVAHPADVLRASRFHGDSNDKCR
jgi:hypothetical protein